jgi:hypothetical protein
MNEVARTPFRMSTQKTPDVFLSGETVEQIILCLNNNIVFAKSQDGSLRPFVDPQPIMQIISAAIQASQRPQQQPQPQPQQQEHSHTHPRPAQQRG